MCITSSKIYLEKSIDTKMSNQVCTTNQTITTASRGIFNKVTAGSTKFDTITGLHDSYYKYLQ